MIIVHLGEECKTLDALRCPDRPDAETKELGRKLLAIDACPHCDSDRLHGQGWRRRFVVTSWWDPSQWTPLWYWRVECQDCFRVIPLVLDIALPRLMYTTAVVLAVVVGRLGGASPDDFTPSPRTQDRWLNRFQRWWLVALAAKAKLRPRASDIGDAEEMLASIWSAASAGVRLVAPTHALPATKAAMDEAHWPGIWAHQRCKMTPG